MADPREPLTLLSLISASRQAVPLALALAAVLLGFVPLRPWELLLIGQPAIAQVRLK
jgi:hypothetical protein